MPPLGWEVFATGAAETRKSETDLDGCFQVRALPPDTYTLVLRELYTEIELPGLELPP
jgi:hypothetical protein